MRYFFEVSYKGTNYSGFQLQQNANTIQAEVEKVFKIFFRKSISLTGSSRTDAGVHALQNFFHGDFEHEIKPDLLYNFNAILPPDIVLKKITPVHPNAHCRFDAISREYHYFIYDRKDPFMVERGYYYPQQIDFDKLNSAAAIILSNTNFLAFSKRNSQVKTHECRILKIEWLQQPYGLIFKITGNRFLRGMVRALVATMLRVGTHRITIEEFQSIFEDHNKRHVNFAAPPQALFLVAVNFPLVVVEKP